MPVKCFPWYGMIHVVLCWQTFSVLSTKVSQDLTFIRRMSVAMNETVFWFAHRVIYISFSTIFSPCTHCGVNLWQVGSSSLIAALTSTVGIFPGGYFIRRFYYTFINRFINLLSLKHVNSFLKWNRFTIKAFHIGLLRSSITIQFSYVNFIIQSSLWEGSQILIQFNQVHRIASYL